MKIWTAATNATLLLVAQFGFQERVVDFKGATLPTGLEDMLFRPAGSSGSLAKLIGTAVHGSGFRESRRQFHYFYALPSVYSKQKRSQGQGHSSSSRPHVNIPVYLLPSLTSYLFYSGSTSNSSPSASEGTSKALKIATGVFCISKEVDTDYVPAQDKICDPLGCGEDSFCLADDEGYFLLAVADGVGGWRKKGIDPALFSQALMRHTRSIFLEEGAKRDQDRNYSRSLLRDAFWRLVDDFAKGRGKPYGSSTACLVMIDRHSGAIRYANLGDSGFMILTPKNSNPLDGQREYQVKYKSASQQFRFNAPYQLYLGPPDVVSDTSDLAATEAAAPPEMRQKIFTVDPGDVVLLMSDGVLDNVFDDEMVHIVSQQLPLLASKYSPEEVPRLLAREVAVRARAWSLDQMRESPFSVEARKHNHNFLGGKEDDITVLAAVISDE